jgi:hypothetical protein
MEMNAKLALLREQTGGDPSGLASTARRCATLCRACWLNANFSHYFAKNCWHADCSTTAHAQAHR